MPGTALGVFVIDFIARPFARIYEKWPVTMVLLLLVVYAIVGYLVIKSAYQTERQY
ncbi:MAG: hypothetical protein K2X29_05230 [Candidatus Obscuribacterales bacterium]|nr:hypothetical protein [Candidatus Obscuribacterales bacterium]